MDDADRADIRIEEITSDAILEARLFVQAMDDGKSGECDFCGGYFTRLVDGACGWCRDKYRFG